MVKSLGCDWGRLSVQFIQVGIWGNTAQRSTPLQRNESRRVQALDALTTALTVALTSGGAAERCSGYQATGSLAPITPALLSGPVSPLACLAVG